MRILLVNIGDTTIEFDNNMWTGHENIYVNGELVSRKFSVFGTKHVFDVREDGEWTEYILTTGFGWQGIEASIWRNGVPIVQSGRCGLQVNVPRNGYRVEDLV
jgi:hypothetical protein